MRKLIANEEIVQMCERIGNEINEKFAGKNPLLICVLKGAAPFHSELIKHIDIDMEVDYIEVKSYQGTQSTGNLEIKKDVSVDIENRHIIIVDDIVDTGLTLYNLKNEYLKRNVGSVSIATMLDKPSRRKIEIKPDFCGRVIDDLFVIGFGLDYYEKYRNLKDIYVYNED